MWRELRGAYLGALIGLVGQFLLGMATNLFVQVPLDHPGANPSEYFSGVAQSVIWAIFHGPSVWLVLHAVWGLLLVAFGFRLLIMALGSHHRPTIITAVIGALAMLGAGFNGGSYLNYHQDFSSMIMASFFAIAVTAYAIGLWSLPQAQPARSQ
ncbi:MAG TPA: hypothetical protein VFK22_09365 [Candidatus Dormibacteraeota bacterium]|nr:hypothetical protein [Candidatus Dormibacteraeota bacterium]